MELLREKYKDKEALQVEALDAADLPEAIFEVEVLSREEWRERFQIVIDKAMLDAVLTGRCGKENAEEMLQRILVRTSGRGFTRIGLALSSSRLARSPKLRHASPPPSTEGHSGFLEHSAVLEVEAAPVSWLSSTLLDSKLLRLATTGIVGTGAATAFGFSYTSEKRRQDVEKTIRTGGKST